MSEGERNAAEVRKEIEEQYQALENAGAAHAGLNDLLVAYGAYEAAVQQADAYLGLLNPTPTFTTSDTSK